MMNAYNYLAVHGAQLCTPSCNCYQLIWKNNFLQKNQFVNRINNGFEKYKTSKLKADCLNYQLYQAISRRKNIHNLLDMYSFDIHVLRVSIVLRKLGREEGHGFKPDEQVPCSETHITRATTVAQQFPITLYNKSFVIELQWQLYSGSKMRIIITFLFITNLWPYNLPC